MTVSDKEFTEIFGQQAAWELAFVRQPDSLFNMVATILEDSIVARYVEIALRNLTEERKAKPAKPTMCLLCNNDFLRFFPTVIVVMRPVTREGPAACFSLCEDCTAKPEIQNRVHAFLGKRLGAQFVEWGHA
jgi:hypothetical protein